MNNSKLKNGSQKACVEHTQEKEFSCLKYIHNINDFMPKLTSYRRNDINQLNTNTIKQKLNTSPYIETGN